MSILQPSDCPRSPQGDRKEQGRLKFALTKYSFQRRLNIGSRRPSCAYPSRLELAKSGSNALNNIDKSAIPVRPFGNGFRAFRNALKLLYHRALDVARTKQDRDNQGPICLVSLQSAFEFDALAEVGFQKIRAYEEQYDIRGRQQVHDLLSPVIARPDHSVCPRIHNLRHSQTGHVTVELVEQLCVLVRIGEKDFQLLHRSSSVMPEGVAKS